MKKKPVFIAFSTQKGGVGKTTFTVLTASYLHYVRGYNVLVVDCDFPQYSINMMRKRDAEQLNVNQTLHEMAIAQFSKIGKPTYTILCSSPEDSIEVVGKFMEETEEQFDFVFFDLPGTINNAGVVNTLSEVDYIFTPISADKISLESTISFASVVKQCIVDEPGIRNKGIYLFWNMVDGREKTNLYEVYEKVIAEMNIPLLKTVVPNTTKYKKEGLDEGTNLFRSTIFPASRVLLKDSRLVELLDEILLIINTENNGE